MLSFSLSFSCLLAGLVCFLLKALQVEIEKNNWLLICVAVYFIGIYLLGQYYVLRNNRGLLMLQPFAPLVEKNKWLYPLTAVLFICFSFVVFFSGLSLMETLTESK